MKKIFNGIFSLLIVCSLFACGGGASPPAGIPAPVSQLLAVSNPDASGNVTVSGDAGAVTGGANVTATNITQTAQGTPFKDLFIKKAYAGTLPPVFVATTTAAPDGSFRLTLSANLGDEIEVVQEVNGEVSDPTILVVSGNNVALGGTVRGLGVDKDLAVAYPTSGLNGDGQVFALNFLDNTPLSFPNPDFLISAFGGITEISINGIDRRGLAVSPTENSLACLDLDNPNSPVFLGLGASPVAVNIQPFGTLAAVGIQSDLESITLIETNPCGFFNCTILIQHPLGETHVATRFVQIRPDIVIALSEFADGSYWVTQIDTSACPGTPSPQAAGVELPSGILPGGMAIYNFFNNVLVSDSNSNQVYLVDFSGPSITPITVGENPMGIDVDAAENYAFVVNRADNGFSSVSKINLMDLSVVTREGAGLKPTHIGLLDEFGLAAILSSVDNAVTVIDINF